MTVSANVYASAHHLLVSIEAALRCFEFGIIAAFLFDQEILRAAGFDRGGQRPPSTARRLRRTERGSPFPCSSPSGAGLMRPGLALIHATGSAPISTQVPTSNCIMKSFGVLAASTSMGARPSVRWEQIRTGDCGIRRASRRRAEFPAREPEFRPPVSSSHRDFWTEMELASTTNLPPIAWFRSIVFCRFAGWKLARALCVELHLM